MTRPEVSVVVTNYNHADTVLRAIRSASAQQTTFPFEIVVVDDGSTDGSVGVLCGHKSGTKTRIYLEDHKGFVAAYVKAFSECRGRYIAIMDADDWNLRPDRLQMEWEYLETHRSKAVVFTDTQYPASVPARMDYRSLMAGCYVAAPTAMFRNTQAGYDWLLGLYTWDYALWLSMFKTYTDPIGYVRVNTVRYEVSTESVAHTRSRRRRMRHVWGVFLVRVWALRRVRFDMVSALRSVWSLAWDTMSVILKRW